MVATVGLQVARNESDKFILSGQIYWLALPAFDPRRYIRPWRNALCVDTVVNNADLRAKRLGKGAGLPLRRCDTRIGDIKM